MQFVKSGYNCVGRYLGPNVHKMTRDELCIILDAGLRVFPIYEHGGTVSSHFTAVQGVVDANEAIKSADDIGFGYNVNHSAIIYFAVDYDASDSDIVKIIDYFKVINIIFNNRIYEPWAGRYQVGVYGPRYVCERVSEAGFAVSSFICDMSSGFSANLGHVLPSNWAFDQIFEDKIINIDHDFSNGKDTGAGAFIVPPTEHEELITIPINQFYVNDTIYGITIFDAIYYKGNEPEEGIGTIYSKESLIFLEAILDSDLPAFKVAFRNKKGDLQIGYYMPNDGQANLLSFANWYSYPSEKDDTTYYSFKAGNATIFDTSGKKVCTLGPYDSVFINLDLPVSCHPEHPDWLKISGYYTDSANKTEFEGYASTSLSPMDVATTNPTINNLRSE